MVASLVSQSPNQDLHPMADAPRSTHEVMSKSASIMVSLAINQEIKMKKKKKLQICANKIFCSILSFYT